MGVFNCHKHGISGVRLVSPDIQKQVIANEIIRRHQVIEVLLYDEGEVMFSRNYLVSDSFIKKNHLVNRIHIKSSEDEEYLLQITTLLVPVCGRCLESLLVLNQD